MLYTIGEMAKKLGVPTSTLRYYDKEGLLPFVERSDGGIRVFKDTDYEWLFVIECLKKAGMPLKDIRIFIGLAMQGDETINQRLAIFQKQRKAVEEQLSQLQETHRVLDYKCWYYETAKKAGTTAVPRAAKTEDVPEEFHAVKEEFDRLREFK